MAGSKWDGKISACIGAAFPELRELSQMQQGVVIGSAPLLIGSSFDSGNIGVLSNRVQSQPGTASNFASAEYWSKTEHFQRDLLKGKLMGSV